MEHHQTVERTRRGTPGWRTTAWCTSTNFQLQILILKQYQIFKISIFHKFYYSFQKTIYPQNIPKNHPKI